MKKYTHIDQLIGEKRAPTPKNQQPTPNHQQQSSSSSYPYYYRATSNNNSQQIRSTIPKTIPYGLAPQHGDTESIHQKQHSTPSARAQRATQRTLNETCRQDRVSPIRQRTTSLRQDRQYQKQMQNYICKLKDIKVSLQKEIQELQCLLDNTSVQIDNMDSQFERIKFKILDYTSRALNSAFKNYKMKMVRWSKYEEVEKKGLQLIAQLNDYIHEQKQIVETVRSGEVRTNLNSNSKELINRTAHYSFMVKEIKKVREECLMKHPTLREDKILQFEHSLQELCCF